MYLICGKVIVFYSTKHDIKACYLYIFYMIRIKLNAIQSTNTFLKDLVSNQDVKNYTVVSAEKQFNGRGQVGSKWESEEGKNLIFSVFVVLDKWCVKDATYLNFAVSLAVYNSLKDVHVPKLSVKWPNDILSDSNKICGILIENSIQGVFIKSAIIGIGLNVNQEKFSENLDSVSSIKNSTGVIQNREGLLDSIVENLKKEMSHNNLKHFESLKTRYLKNLYKYEKPCMFKAGNQRVFMGKIVGVNPNGNLKIEHADGEIETFGVKQIKMYR